MKDCWVYILSNKSKTLYIGVTGDLQGRIYEHKQKLTGGFTKKYRVSSLEFYETTSDVQEAITREKQLKGWRRSKKIALIESTNPEWNDLSLSWYG